MSRTWGESSQDDVPNYPQQRQQPPPQQKQQLTAGGMPVPEQKPGGRVRRLSRRLSGGIKELFGGGRAPPPDADRIIPPEDLEVRLPRPRPARPPACSFALSLLRL